MLAPGFEVKKKFVSYLQKFFLSDIEELNFVENEQAADRINQVTRLKAVFYL
jgi:serine protease inhibitor